MNATAPKDVGEAHRILGTNGFRESIRNDQRPFEPKGKRQPDSRDLPEIIDIMDFLDKPLSKPPQLIKGLFDKGTKLILSGASKSRKTWALAHLGVCVATGQPWWGFETVKGKVLYANFEILPAFFQERVQSIKDKMFVEARQLKGQFSIWNLRGFAADLDQLANKIIERAGDKFDLIILDPIYKVLGDRDENSNGEMAELMNVIDRIITATGAAVAFAHHYSKGNQAKKNAMDRMSGAGVFARDADSLLMMTEHQTENTFTVQPVLRNHKLVEPFCVTVDHPIMERWDGADPTKLKDNSVPQKKHFVADLMKLFNGEELRRVELQQRFNEAKIGSSGTFNNLFREARDNKHIEECDNGKKWKAFVRDDANIDVNQREEKNGMVQ